MDELHGDMKDLNDSLGRLSLLPAGEYWPPIVQNTDFLLVNKILASYWSQNLEF